MFLGRGIFASDGEQWQTQRKNASHLFKVRELKQMAVAFADHGRVLVDVLEIVKGRPVDIQALFARFTFDSFCEVAYGRSFDSLLDENNAFSRAFNEAQSLTANRILFPIYKLLGPLAALLPSERRLVAAMRILHDTTTQIVRDFRAATKEGDVSDKVKSSLLARFVDDKLSDLEIRETVLNFLLAGRDTTATTLTFAIYFVFQMPQVVQKLRAEIAEVSDEVTFENHTRFKYCLAVMDETMRLAPPVPIDVHFAAETHKLPSGVVIPKVRVRFVRFLSLLIIFSKGMGAAWTAFMMGRDPRMFADPLVFRPERFLDKHHNGGIEITTGNIPFQYGPRRCLGERMAYLEVVATLVKLVNHFDFEIVPQTLIFEPSIVLYAANGVKAIATRRRKQN